MAEQESQSFENALSKQMQQEELPESDSLHNAIINVMNEVEGIDKGMTIGQGHHSYKGVADKDVKKIIGQSMMRNGLTCLPIEIVPTMQISEWEEQFNATAPVKRKQSVFTSVMCRFQITHAESKESIVIAGYGHGVDPQDKGAGKATTYALKNALLYMFLVPTGAIDDTDATHSKDIQTPQTPVKTPTKTLPFFNADQFDNAKKFIKEGKATVFKIKKKYMLTEDQEHELIELEKTSNK